MPVLRVVGARAYLKRNKSHACDGVCQGYSRFFAIMLEPFDEAGACTSEGIAAISAAFEWRFFLLPLCVLDLHASFHLIRSITTTFFVRKEEAT